MLVTIIVPAHKLNEYLKKCLKSIDSQNCLNYEVIVVSDNSKEVVDYVKQEYSHFKILNTYYDGWGVAKARNLGADNAKGELLIFVDSDCIITPNLVQTYRDNYVESCLMIGGIEGWDSSGKKLLTEDLRDVFLLNKKSTNGNLNEWWFEDISWGIHHTLNFYTGNVGLSKKDFLEGFRFNEELLGFVDMYYAIEHYSMYGRIKYINTFVKHLEPLTNWRTDESQFNYKIFAKMVENNYPQMLNCEHYNIMIHRLENYEGINL